MYQLAPAQKTSTVKIPVFSFRLQTEKRVLKVNKSDITGGNAFNGDLAEIEGNHESSKKEKACFQVFQEICYPCFNKSDITIKNTFNGDLTDIEDNHE